MNAMSSVWDRRNRRISYQVPVGVVDLQAERVLNMSSINVSRGGIFVDTDEHMRVGAPVVCNLPFGRDTEALQLRGRVAWLRPKSSSGPKRPSGLGIEFVDLSDDESDKLSDIVGGDDEQSHQLSLKLPGLENPVHGQAFLTNDGVFFRSKLPFLALDSEVEFAFEDEDEDVVYDGHIVGVEVYNDPGSPVPRLQVEVAVASDEMPSRLDIPSGEIGESYEMLHIDTADTERTLAPSVEPVIEIPQMMPIVVAEIEALSIVQDDVVVERTERVSPPPRSFAKIWPPVALLVGSILGILAFALSQGQGAEPAPKPSAALAVEKGIHELPVNATQTPTVAPNEATAARERIRAAALEDQVELGAMGDGEPAKTVAEATPAPATKKVAPSAFEIIGGVNISEKEGAVVLRLPIEGSLERAADYLLADPPGLAVNLPYAQPKGGFHQSVSPMHDNLRSVWVRERLGGLHFRVFFSESAESCAVKYTPSALIVRCRF
jgi:Tfp pilus assembly protein PilZ